jgi:L-lactate dehydrogenase complex protein LldF
MNGRTEKRSGFQDRIEQAVRDSHLHLAIEGAVSQLRSRRTAAFESLEHADTIRDLARRIKLETLSRLDEHLVTFEERLTENGVRVHWAETGRDAGRLVRKIADDNGVERIVKSKSMVTEEIHLNDALIEAGLEVVETDFGEYIVQLAGDTPSHVILPIIHMTRHDVGNLFHEKLGIDYTDDPGRLARYAREQLRGRFIRADMGVTGANFGVAESGTICLVSNEGNIRMVTTLPRVHVAILGIEKIVPTLADLELFLRLLARSGTGQKLTAYTSLIQGPRRGPEEEGPDEVHVILLDNGRSDTLAGDEAEILACFRCGACLNTCPVYKSIGGHAYGDTYPGPMGAVLTPCLRGREPWDELAHASSLCGACREICPLRIDIPRMLLSLRRIGAEEGRHRGSLKWALRLARAVAGYLSRRRAVDGWIESGVGPLKAWTRSRDFPAPARFPFHDRWRRRGG